MLSISMSPETPAPAAPDLSAPAAELRMATFRLARRLRSQRAVDTMSDAQFAVLAALSVHGQHTLGELADRERVSAPSMNRTVNGLEESGYLTRTTARSTSRSPTRVARSWRRPSGAATRGSKTPWPH